MKLSNSFASAKNNPQEYVQNLLALLDDRDPWEVQEELLGWLTETAGGLQEDQLRQPEKPGKWSVLQVVHHLADTEIVYGYRVRMILSHPGCELVGFDQDSWATEGKYSRAAWSEVLDQLRALRAANLRLYRLLDEEQWERVGIHAERGNESVRHIHRLVAAHDMLHRRQINRILSVVVSG